ncbi:MAG: hypothetical protein ACXACR_01535 [Candidatus Hodarchaeales archaeon]
MKIANHAYLNIPIGSSSFDFNVCCLPMVGLCSFLDVRTKLIQVVVFSMYKRSFSLVGIIVDYVNFSMILLYDTVI